jgi:hypothetical protein
MAGQNEKAKENKGAGKKGPGKKWEQGQKKTTDQVNWPLGTVSSHPWNPRTGFFGWCTGGCWATHAEWSGHCSSASTDLGLPRSGSDGWAGDHKKVKEKGSPRQRPRPSKQAPVSVQFSARRNGREREREEERSAFVCNKLRERKEQWGLWKCICVSTTGCFSRDGNLLQYLVV